MSAPVAQTHRGLEATRRGLVLAEGALSGCLWLVILGVAFVAGWAGGLLLGLPWWVGVAACGGVGALAAGWLARDRRRRTEALLATRPGARRFPSLLRPFTVPMSVWHHDGVTRIWRLHGVVPNGRAATAEVMVEARTGASFVAWGPDRPRPPSARGAIAVVDPVVPGCLVAARDPSAVAPAIGRAVAELAALVPEDGHVAVYPFGLWWRVVGPVDEARLRGAEEGLIALAAALDGP